MLIIKDFFVLPPLFFSFMDGNKAFLHDNMSMRLSVKITIAAT